LEEYEKLVCMPWPSLMKNGLTLLYDLRAINIYT